MHKEAYLHKSEAKTQTMLQQVYMWMFMGLLLTGLIATHIASNEAILNVVAQNPTLIFGALILEIAIVIGLSFGREKISPTLAIAGFFFYSALNGLTLSLIFLVYTNASIATAFFTAAGMFGVMSAVGYFTKMDLSKLRSYFMMALVGIIIASLINLFLRNPMMYWIISYAGVVIFLGLTAYDTQKIKNWDIPQDQTELFLKFSIFGALILYLDFINLFLFLLRIMGRRR